MALSPTPRGRGAVCHFAFQDDFVTGADGDNDWSLLNFYSETLDLDEEPVEDPELGDAVDNPGDPTGFGPGLPSAPGTITVPADTNQAYYWLRLLFGPAVTTDDTGGNYTHVFKSGAEALPAATLDFALRSDRRKVAYGVVANGFSMGINKAEGYRQMTIDLLCRRLTTAGAAIDNAPAAIPARSKLAASLGHMLINDVQVATLESGDVRYQNNIELAQLADSTKYPGAADPGDRAFTFNPTFRAQKGVGADAISAAFDGPVTESDLKFVYQASATKSLAFRLRKGIGAPKIEQISGPGFIKYSTNIKARQTTGGAPAPMLEVTLKNQLAGLDLEEE